MAGNIVWLDIPVKNLDRAIAFYSAVLGETVKKDTVSGMELGILHHGGTDIGGCLYKSDKDKPGKSGPLVYFSVEGRLEAACEEATKLGGKVVIPKMAIGQHGFRAVVLDSEGNRVALHSMK
ncbi:MAG TPA: VOC family protein [Planctomycetota bacterium]|nr:VOC family protein [Planctomycetota bacterium]